MSPETLNTEHPMKAESPHLIGLRSGLRSEATDRQAAAMALSMNRPPSGSFWLEHQIVLASEFLQQALLGLGDSFFIFF
ncbi:MAG: hypothetical protein ABSE16_20080, partial [Verrucomicrobiota bacterium]